MVDVWVEPATVFTSLKPWLLPSLKLGLVMGRSTKLTVLASFFSTFSLFLGGKERFFLLWVEIITCFLQEAFGTLGAREDVWMSLFQGMPLWGWTWWLLPGPGADRPHGHISCESGHQHPGGGFRRQWASQKDVMNICFRAKHLFSCSCIRDS